jgi:hypothetical protein
MSEMGDEGREAIVGDRIRTFEFGDVKFEGTIVAIFTKKSGRMRYFVESDDGVEMTFNSGMIYVIHPELSVS